MRWSPLVSIFTVLAVISILEGVFAAPLDVDLENRAKIRPTNAEAREKMQKGVTLLANAVKVTLGPKGEL
jgi:hypothetical protein